MRLEVLRRGMKKAAVFLLAAIFCILLLPFCILSAGLRMIRLFFSDIAGGR